MTRTGVCRFGRGRGWQASSVAWQSHGKGGGDVPIVYALPRVACPPPAPAHKTRSARRRIERERRCTRRPVVRRPSRGTVIRERVSRAEEHSLVPGALAGMDRALYARANVSCLAREERERSLKPCGFRLTTFSNPAASLQLPVLSQRTKLDPDLYISTN